MCSRKKISLSENPAAIVPAKNKTGLDSRSAEEHRTSAETRKGTKTNRDSDGK